MPAITSAITKKLIQQTVGLQYPKRKAIISIDEEHETTHGRPFIGKSNSGHSQFVVLAW